MEIRDGDKIAKEMKAARLRAGLTQKEASDLAGFTQSHLSMLENGQRRITPDTAEKLYKIYGNTSFGPGVYYSESEAIRCVNALEELTALAGSEELSNAVSTYICQSAYLMLRSVFLSNPENSEEVFSLDDEQVKMISDLVHAEPHRVAIIAKESNQIDSGDITPDAFQTEQLNQIINFCEQQVKDLKKDGE
ncbi:MAG: helix-turn-helix transcriptional regulator [Ruminococcus sp.]|nr:helix-turn-helix transcriptional regulator [Ruminococcus sp.]